MQDTQLQTSAGDVAGQAASRARTLGAQGNLSAAEGEYRHALEIAPDDSRILFDYALFLLTSGEPEAAVTQAKRLTSLVSPPRGAYFLLGRALRAVDDFEGALAALRRALIDEPGRAGALHLTGLVMEKLGLFKEGAHHIASAIAATPADHPFLTSFKDDLLRLRAAEASQARSSASRPLKKNKGKRRR